MLEFCFGILLPNLFVLLMMENIRKASFCSQFFCLFVKTDRLEEEHYVRRERSFKESNAKLQHSMVQNSTKLCKTLVKLFAQ
jgi:hypothetical protein